MKQLANPLQSPKYSFRIKMQNGQELYLTGADRTLLIDNQTFIPNSGISIKEGWFNDAAENYIILQGVFETNGIEQQMNLIGSNVKIYVDLANCWNHFVTYYCTHYNKSDLSFTMHLEPNVKAYNQLIVQSFSQNCRANFGDKRCKVDKEDYSQIYNIKEMFAKTLVIDYMDKENSYFILGDAILVDSGFTSKIVNQIDNIITLDKIITDNIRHISIVKLIAGCDKNFITCCNKFNNAVNFRGEPLIPKDDFIKVP